MGLGYTPANQAALLEYEAWIDRLVTVGVVDEEDKPQFMAAMRDGFYKVEQTRQQQIRDFDEKLTEQAASNATAISQTAFQRTVAKGKGKALAPPRFNPMAGKERHDEEACERLLRAAAVRAETAA